VQSWKKNQCWNEPKTLGKPRNLRINAAELAKPAAAELE